MNAHRSSFWTGIAMIASGTVVCVSAFFVPALAPAAAAAVVSVVAGFGIVKASDSVPDDVHSDVQKIKSQMNGSSAPYDGSNGDVGKR